LLLTQPLQVPRSFVAEARKRVGPKKLRIRPIIDRLATEHEDATIALTFRSELELLVSVMLSAQTTDVNVNRVTATLFEKYRRPEDYLAVEQEELERDIFATGFYRQTAELGSPQGIVVDTHVRRLSQRLGFSRQEDPVKIERDLVRLVPREDWGRFPHLLIWHGRRVCIARRPRCEDCVINDLCPSSRV
jgi:endonuclease-3